VDHENAQIVREFSELMSTDRGLTSAMELVHPQAVFDWSASRAPYRGVFHGHAAIREAAEALWDAWEEWDPQFEDVIEIDPETILVVNFIRARGKGSGIPVEARGASLWTVRDGKIMGAKLFQSKAEALEAVGVPDAASRQRGSD
jgi:ketosteroid isomerase-like protein